MNTLITLTRNLLLVGALAVVPAFATGCADEASPVDTASEALSGSKKKLRLCGGDKGDTCPKGFYCRHRDETCDMDGVGWCEALPDACPKLWDPVCGCDGLTYPNECSLTAAQGSLLHEGTCDQPPGSCAGNQDCKPWEFCKLPTGSCGEGELGQCGPRPHYCTQQYAPVCGCDGQTYGNECFAHAAAVSVQHQGECETELACFADSDCPPGHVCVIETWCPDCYYSDPPCLAPCYAKGTCQPACPQILCMEGTIPHDTDGDGCDDACLPECLDDADCPAGMLCQLEEYCPPCVYGVPACDMPCWLTGVCVDACPQILCQDGTLPYDSDGDGCDDTCLKQCFDSDDCAPGQKCEPYTWCLCGSDPLCDAPCLLTGVCIGPTVCEVQILCVAGTLPVDTDGDGCDDACKAPCEDVCDCYDNPDLEFSTPCPLMCMNCGNFWTCEAGLCEENCGFIPPDLTQMCKEECTSDADCPDGYYCEQQWDCPCTGFNCLVACQPWGGKCVPKCDFAIDCAPGYLPVDTDGDGCDDACKAPCQDACDCYDAGLSFPAPCDKDCMTCDNYWTCDAGFCEAECGPVPWDVQLCKESECLDDADCAFGQHCELTAVCPCGDTDPACLAPCWLIGECKPWPGCCETDADCGAGQTCAGDVCKEALPMGQCWDDGDCYGDATCAGSSVCPCGAACFAPDQPGKCVSPWDPCKPDGTCQDGFECQCLPDPSCPICDVCWFGCVPADEPTGCYGDQDCPAGTKCNAGDICLPPPGCDVPGTACPAVCYGYCEGAAP